MLDLQQVCADLAITRGQLARRAGLDESAIEHVEKGRRLAPEDERALHKGLFLCRFDHANRHAEKRRKRAAHRAFRAAIE